MGRRSKKLTPRQPPRVLLRSRGCPAVWSEHGQDGVRVHYPGVVLRAPASCSPEVRKVAERLRGAFLFGGDAARADLALLMDAAFGDQDVERVPLPERLVCLAHVLKAWGVSTTWL